MTDSPKPRLAKLNPAPTGLQRAIEVAGGELNLADAINIPASVISWWLRSQGSPALGVVIGEFGQRRSRLLRHIEGRSKTSIGI
jgi:hypothetical protein